MTETDRYVFNILRTYARATDADVADGIAWYPLAHDLANSMLPGDALRAAAIIAMFSPRTPWERNLMLAQVTCATGVAPGHMFTDYAQRLINGEEVFSVVKGDKTRAFCSTIANSGNHDVTVIDGHAYDIADGKVWGKSRPNIGKRVYRDMDEAYHIAANAAGFDQVSELQAITWVSHRRVIGMDWRG